MSQTEVQLIKDSAVVTADIADQAVTLDKLPHGTSSNNGKFLRANNGADPSFETVTSTTINNNADNRVITGSGTADTLEAESAVTVNSGRLFIGNTNPAASANADDLCVGNNDNSGETGITLGSNTASGIRFADGASNSAAVIEYEHGSTDALKFFQAGSERMRIDSSGRLLLGHTAVGSKGAASPLQVQTADSGAFAVTIRNRTSNNDYGFIGFTDDDASEDLAQIGVQRTAANTGDIFFYTNGGSSSASERLRINSSGNVLIGTASSRDLGGLSSQLLAVEGTSGSAAIAIINNQSSTGFGSLRFSKSRGTSVGSSTVVNSGDTLGGIVFCGADGTDMASIGAQIICDVDGTPGSNDMPGRLEFHTTPDGSATSTERLRIHSGGQVSMGQTSSYTSVNHDYQLVVTPNITDSSKGALGILIDGEHGTSGGASVDSISLKVKNTNTWNNATHQYGGYFEVNQQLLQPQTGVYSQATGLYNVQKCFSAQLNKNINAVTTGISYYSNIVETGSGGAAYHAQFFDNGTEKLQIRLGGNILNANNTYGSLSDVKLKENIVDANSQWDDIKGLKIRNFNFKNDPDKVKMLGVIAQEAETVSAGLIETNDDVEINNETGEGTKTGTTKYVKYSILYMKSVKALQEAMSRIEILETEVATLKSA